MGGRGVSSRSQLEAMAAGKMGISAEASEKLLNAPWQKYSDGNKVTVGATLAQAEARIAKNNYEIGVLVDEQGFVVAAYKGGKHSVNFGYEPASLFQNGTITHNHPSGYAIFSQADLATPALYAMEGGKLASIRATTKSNGTISVRANKSNADWNKLATAYAKVDDRLWKQATSASDFSAKSAAKVYANWLSKNAPKYGFTVEYEV